MSNVKRLRAFGQAHRMALAVYQATRAFPPEERYGLAAQLRRAVVSVGANLAEGCGRLTDAELARFTGIARGSLGEVEFQLLLAKDLGFLPEEQWRSLDADARALGGMLTNLRKYLSQRRQRG